MNYAIVCREGQLAGDVKDNMKHTISLSLGEGFPLHNWHEASKHCMEASLKFPN